MDIIKSLDGANNRLKSLKVTILQRGDRLSLQATLPPKPKFSDSELDKATSKWQQQKISLGLRANLEGVRFAEAKAREISGLLLAGTFEWEPYMKASVVVEPKTRTWGEVIPEFEAWYRTRNSIKDRTWQDSYREYLRRLPSDQPISSESVLDVLKRLPPDAKRARQMAIIALRLICDYAEIAVDFEAERIKRGKRERKVIRDIPTDQLICESFNLMRSPQWKCAYGLLACFGLRPHELKHLDLSEYPPVMNVLEDTKTGARRIYPIPADWLELFDLKDIWLPNTVNFGDYTSKRFVKDSVPFNPYDLRHAYAIRGTVVQKIPLPVMARMMGHSPQQHLNTYNYWLSQSQIDEIMNNS
jgi:integrase